MNQNKHISGTIKIPRHLTVSSDGYVRISFAAASSLKFIHFLSGLDASVREVKEEGGIRTFMSGYTEWLTESNPVITLGWDWCIDLVGGLPTYIRRGPPRTNLMFVNHTTNQDLLDTETEVLLCKYVDRLNWQSELDKHMTTRFAWTTNFRFARR